MLLISFVFEFLNEWRFVCLCGGQPKHPRHDAWDRAMDERDARLKEEYEKSQVSVSSLIVFSLEGIVGIGARAYPLV